MGTEQAPELLFELVLGRRISPETIEWLASGFAVYERNDGGISLERCLKLPSRTRRTRQRRDYWICEAAKQLPAATPYATAAELTREIDAFWRGSWRRWSERADPPPGVGPLREALFRMAQSLGGRAPPCAKRIEQILREANSR